MPWTTEEARTLVDGVFVHSKAPECEVAAELSDTAHTRFAANEVTTSGSSRDVSLTITSRGAGKSGSVRVNEIDPDSLKRAVARSEELMALAPADPEFMEGLAPQSYPAIDAFNEDTAAAGAEKRRDGVRATLERSRTKGLDASGFYETEASWSVLANRAGLFGFHRATSASFSTTMRTADGTGSGWAGFGSPSIRDVNAGDMASRAASKAVSSASPRDLPPGRYTVVLEPQAVADLIGNLGFALSGRAADEGRGFFAKPGGAKPDGSTRLGEKIFADSVTLASDPFDPRVPGRPWAGGGGRGGGGGFGGGGGSVTGLPARRVTWIEKGVLRNLSLDRYWARKTQREPLPFSGSLVMEGGAGSVDDLVAGTQRGLLVTRFWYIRSVNPQTLQLTGLTRDGIWLIEDGKVTTPVNNFRFNESPALMLQNIDAMSAAVSTGDMVVPAIRAREFNFSSKSDAV